MKKIIIICVCILLCLTGHAFAADFVIVDILNVSSSPYPYLALTEDGKVFQTDTADGTKKTVIKTGVSSLTNVKGVYLLQNGNVDFYGNEITGLNVREIIGIGMCTDSDILYVDYEGCLKLYSLGTQGSRIILENFKDIKYVPNINGGIYSQRSLLVNKNNELYYWYLPTENGYNYDLENSTTKYITSDVVDFEINDTEAYYLKSNGELYKYNLSDFQSDLVMREVDIWQGIEIRRSAVMVYADGRFYLNGSYGTQGYAVVFNKSDTWVPYECQYGVNDMAIYGQAIYYIGKDNLLHSYNLYDYYASGRKKLTTLSYDIAFKQIYTPGKTNSYGIYALAEDNSLYKVDSAGTTESAWLVNAVPNAIPRKFSYHSGMMILSEAGECYYSSAIEENKMFQMCFSNKDTQILINNEMIQLESPVQIKNGRSMYPLRECFNAMGASVIWDAENKIAIGEIPGTKIEFPIGKNEYWINGVKYEMDVPSYIDDSLGRTYIPIRYAAEGLGFTVDWLSGDLENTISIYK